MRIRILLADDHRIVRDGLRALIEQQPDMTVVAEAEDGRTAVQLARAEEPDVAILDIGMPELNGIDATAQIRAAVPRTRVIALSMHSDRRFVAGALRAGASGYLLKDCAFEELTRAIHTVVANQTYLSPAIAGTVVEGYVRGSASTAAEANPPVELTAREREILQLIAEGCSTREIAGRLFVSDKTVETHRRNIMEKLDLHSIADLTRYAIRIGLTPLGD
ncbi:MAG: response regulator transcription factor [Gemmatimonadota bacterium]